MSARQCAKAATCCSMLRTHLELYEELATEGLKGTIEIPEAWWDEAIANAEVWLELIKEHRDRIEVTRLPQPVLEIDD